MEDLKSGDLCIQATVQENVLRLDWQGKSIDRAPSKILRPYFKRIEESATQAKQTVEMHFEGLEHFNSSTVAALIQWIQGARACKLKTVIVFDANLTWQKLSFEALRIFEKPDGLLVFKHA